MGLDIGFTLYEKKPWDEEGRLVRADVGGDGYENWRCGWGRPNESWGHMFEFGEQYVVPVFQKGLTDRKPEQGDGDPAYKLVDFDEFADYVHEACTDEYHEASEYRQHLRSEREACKEAIDELRELQRGCTSDNEYAFDRWNDEISDNKERIKSIDGMLAEDDFGEERQAKSVNALLEAMEEHVKQDKYYVVPYFDC